MDSADSGNGDLLKRLSLFGAIVQYDATLYYELYSTGGQHPQDISRARMCDTFLVLLTRLVPELLEVEAG